jgi:hypothetical protein
MNPEEPMKKMTILLATTFLIGAYQHGAAQEKAKRYPKLAPFSAVRWKESTPEVKVKDVWYELLAIEQEVVVHHEEHTASLPDPCRVVSRAKGKSTRFCPGDFFWDRSESAQIVTETVDG